MSGKRRRPNAYEVSFPEEAEEYRARREGVVASSTSNSRASSVASTSTLKRKNVEEAQAPRTKQLPPPAFYTSKAKPVRETARLALPDEDPDDELGGETKPVRVLTDFTVFDPKHRNEMVTLDILETPDMVDRELVVVGYAKPHFDDRNSEDEGQEDDWEVEEAEVLLELSAILRCDIDYLSDHDDRMWIETQFAFYYLEYPSKAYRPFYQHFYSPKRVTQLVLSYAKQHPRKKLSDFLVWFTEKVDPFGHTYVKQDLWDAVVEIYDELRQSTTPDSLQSSPLIQAILNSYHPAAPSKRQRQSQSGPRIKQIPANRLLGSVDISVRKAENQNRTHVTPLIASLVPKESLFETLLAVGSPLPKMSDQEVARRRIRSKKKIWELMSNARSKKTVDWRKEDRVSPGSQYLKKVTINGTEYQIGDTIVFPNSENPYWERPGDFENEDDVPANATISDFFWFAIIRYICQETQTIHVQWFEHGKGIVLQELSHDQHIFLIDLCGIVGYSDVAGKVQVRWNVDVDIPLDVDTFVCNYMHDKDTCSFYDLDTDSLNLANTIRPPDNCPSCNAEQERESEKLCYPTTNEDGDENGFTYGGKKYHIFDFVYYYGTVGPAEIGQIIEIDLSDRQRRESRTHIKIRKVGRISTLPMRILPAGNFPDERHLFLTDEKTEVMAHNLLGTLFVVCESYLSRRVPIDDWLAMSPHHFYMRYQFPTLKPTTYREDQNLIDSRELLVCSVCWPEKIEYIKRLKELDKELRKRPLKTMDLYGGVGAFSHSVAQGSKGLAISHAIEIDASAAKTFKANSPNTVVYNQCANTMLAYTIKTWQGHPVTTPGQLYDENEPVPPPPTKGEIKVVIAGFPCQSFSTMNKAKRVDDVKYNLFLNALSWVDTLRPTYVFFENVKGFLQYRLGGTQAGVGKIEGGIELGGLKLCIRAFLAMDYQVRYSLLEAAHYGTPQGRVRFFLVAARKGYPLPDLPQPSHHFEGSALRMELPYGLTGSHSASPIRTTIGTMLHPTVTIADAIADLPRKAPGIPPRPNVQSFAVGWKSARDAASAKCGVSGAPQYHTNPRSRFQLESRKREAKDIQHFTKVLKPSKVKRTVSIPLTANANYRGLKSVNQEWQLANPLSSKGRSNFRPGAYGRLGKNDTFRTIVTNVDPVAKQSWVLNPYCRRIFTVRELARAQGFPDEFEFKSHGKDARGRDVINVISPMFVQMHRQIGNAVPWPLGRALGRELRSSLLQKFEEQKREAVVIEDTEDSE